MIVLDASFLIAYLDQGDEHHGRATELLLKHAEESFASSVVTVAETLVRPAGEGRLDDARTALNDLGLSSLPMAGDSAPRLARLREQTRLKLPDCCVLLAAQDVTASALLTFDDPLRAAATAAGLTEQVLPHGKGEDQRRG